MRHQHKVFRWDSECQQHVVAALVSVEQFVLFQFLDVPTVTVQTV